MKKNNFRLVGLFGTLALALVLTGTYVFTNYGTNSDLLKGSLDWRIYDPEEVYLKPECVDDSECGVVEVEGIGLMYPSCKKCDPDTRKCVPASESDVCDLDNLYSPHISCAANVETSFVYKMYCKPDDGGVINQPTASGMICGRLSDEKVTLSSTSCDDKPISKIYNAECVYISCDEGVGCSENRLSGKSCNSRRGECSEGFCVPR